MMPWRAAALFFFVVLADQGSKILALAQLDPNPDGTAVRIIRGAFYLKLATNPGGMWGLFSSLPPAVFLAATAAVVAWLLLLIWRLDPAERAYRIPLLLLLGGFLGNGLDRIRLGHVVDIFYVPRRTLVLLSTFNVADLAILTGLIWIFALWAVRSFRARRETSRGAGG